MKKTSTNKKQRKRKLVLTAIAVGAAGVLGYFGWQYWKKKKSGRQAKDNDLDEALKTVTTNSAAIANDIPAISTPKPKAASSAKKSQAAGTGFPLKKGSSGEKVGRLQEALNAKYNAGLKVDEAFGPKTENALKKAGLPITVSESLFNVLVQGTNASSTDASTLGRDLLAAASTKNFDKTLAILKQLKNTEDYTAANEVFRQHRLNGGVRQTIVNGLLNTFNVTDAKEKIKYEFLRMGLQFDGKKWSLSGLDGLPIITVVPATVWINAYKGVKVPARMVLGNQVCKRLDYTLFQNRGKYFLVQSNCVKHL